MYRDDEFPEGLSHSENHLKLRNELEELRVQAETFCDNEEMILGCKPDDIFRKTAHGTKLSSYSKYRFKSYQMVKPK